MLLAGDEFGRTQEGNNNAYCQDNEISWLNWELKEKGKSLIAFVRTVTELRGKYPALRRSRFLDGEPNGTGIKDVTWINATGIEVQDEHWQDGATRCFGMLLDGWAQAAGIPRPGKDSSLLALFNAHDAAVEFTLPEYAGEGGWQLVVDTNLDDGAKKRASRPGTRY